MARLLKVHSVEVQSEKKKFDGAVISIAEAIIGDKHGCFKLVARDGQIPLLKAGVTLTIMNAHAKINKGFLSIEVDKWGIMKEAAPEDQVRDEVNTVNNHSEEEYELVPVTAQAETTDTRGGRGRGRGGRGRGGRGRGGAESHESGEK